ncbi:MULTISPECIES: hypothetical protein [unclassified Nostoc]|uniref:hypothetical protein n=1 Tax=unclassified Nostoc TaxID=2593658 RepID=UPI002635545D|nr:hypothetical protein [Nostoc sp. S13]MDF5734316.1 hypothetical protein [Nostoc sp. S13]
MGSQGDEETRGTRGTRGTIKLNAPCPMPHALLIVMNKTDCACEQKQPVEE